MSSSQPPVYGVGDHQNTGNGAVYGKTDVGPQWPWQTFIDQTNAFRRAMRGELPTPQEEDMPLSQEDLNKIGTLIDAKLDAKLKRITGDSRRHSRLAIC